MRVVITGGGGFLGSHFVEKLQATGCEHMFVVRSAEYDLATENAVERLFADLKAGRDVQPCLWALSGATACVGQVRRCHWRGARQATATRKVCPAGGATGTRRSSHRGPTCVRTTLGSAATAKPRLQAQRACER